MIIKEINDNSALVELEYEEIKCLCIALHKAFSVGQADFDVNFKNIYADATALFGIIQNGRLSEFEVGIMHKLLCSEKQSKTINQSKE
ncbi:MAG: hypothetical protein J6A55_08110 [Oscillospiraceae bacterium]|nr:hypothetical protein [Oscillospiraceae bacterium]